MRNCFSDYRSSNVVPSDSDRECLSAPGRRGSDTPIPLASNAPRLGVIQAPDSESGGSHSPSPRASRKRQVNFKWFFNTNIFKIKKFFFEFCL